MTLNGFGIDDLILATHIAEDYVRLSPRKTILFPHTREALAYLGERYPLHLVTNGFEEVQQPKLDASGLRKYFTTITTSEEAGVKKPEEGFFRLALRKAKAIPRESLMIGDDLVVDIGGARSLGMDTLFFNPAGVLHQEPVTFEINSWDQVRQIL
jgi:putative hydrolase of the HAD superfamily